MPETPNRVLILPFALATDAVRVQAGYLGRQVAFAIRNSLETILPGRATTAPLVADNEGERSWVVNEDWMPEQVARNIATRQGYEGILLGRLSGAAPDQLQLELRFHRDSDSPVHDTAVFGNLFDLVRGGRRLVAGWLDFKDDPERVPAPGFGTTDPVAYADFLLGLDVLLALRSQGVSLPDPARFLDPFDSALHRDGDFGEALAAGLGAAYLAAGEGCPEELLEAAFSMLSRWAARFPHNHRVPLVEAELLIASRRFTQALDVLRALDERIPDLPSDIHRRRSELELQMGHFDDALASFRRLAPEESGAELALKLATIAARSHQFDAAREILDPFEHDILRRRRWILRGALVDRELGETEKMWSRLAALFAPDWAPRREELDRLAQLIVEDPPPPEFVDALRSWFPPQAWSASARLAHAGVLRAAGCPLEARLCLQTIEGDDLEADDRTRWQREKLASQELNFEARFGHLAGALTEGSSLSEKQEERAFLDRILDREPEFWPARFLHALWTAHDGELETAVSELDVVLALAPECDLAWFTRGLQLTRLGRNPEARANMEKAVDIAPDEGDYHAQLALLAAEMRDHVAAQRHLEKALALRPDHPSNERIRTVVENQAG